MCDRRSCVSCKQTMNKYKRSIQPSRLIISSLTGSSATGAMVGSNTVGPVVGSSTTGAMVGSSSMGAIVGSNTVGVSVALTGAVVGSRVGSRTVYTISRKIEEKRKVVSKRRSTNHILAESKHDSPAQLLVLPSSMEPQKVRP